MKTLASLALVVLVAGACSRPLRLNERDPHRYPAGTGALTERNHSRCRTTIISGVPQRICVRGRTPTGPVTDTVPAAPTDTGRAGTGL